MSHNRQNDTDRSGKNHDQRSPAQRQTKAQDQRTKVQAQSDRGNRPGDVGNENPADDHKDRKHVLQTVEIERQLDTSLPIPGDETIREGAENDDALVAADETEVEEKPKKKKGAQPSYGQP